MIWKSCARKWSWPNLNYYSSICLEVINKITKTQPGISAFHPMFEKVDSSVKLLRLHYGIIFLNPSQYGARICYDEYIIRITLSLNITCIPSFEIQHRSE
jgi:hypothetical protein